MTQSNNDKDPLHGVTLQMILRDVVDLYGYKELATMTRIKSFQQENSPLLKPILKFLRKTPWAREKIEFIYTRDIKKIETMKEMKALKAKK